MYYLIHNKGDTKIFFKILYLLQSFIKWLSFFPLSWQSYILPSYEFIIPPINQIIIIEIKKSSVTIELSHTKLSSLFTNGIFKKIDIMIRCGITHFDRIHRVHSTMFRNSRHGPSNCHDTQGCRLGQTFIFIGIRHAGKGTSNIFNKNHYSFLRTATFIYLLCNFGPHMSSMEWNEDCQVLNKK